MVPDRHDELELNARAEPGCEVAAIRAVWDLFASDGVLAAMEELMRISHPDVEVHSYSAREAASPGDEPAEVLRGTDEVLSFYRRATQDGVSIQARARSFDLEGDAVVVTGSTRVSRGDGSFAETKLRWIFRFRDGRVDLVEFETRAAA
jgi:ketosteroid isomerase-like protein